MRHSAITATAIIALSLQAQASTVLFTTFVNGPAISAATGSNTTNNGTIGFNYAFNKFVGSEFYDNQLYSTNLTGGAVTAFGTPLGTGTAAGVQSSASVGEVVLAASLGNGGFAQGDVYAGSGANNLIFHYSNSGSTQTLFTTLPSGSGQIRQIFFDPGSSFGGNMLVTTVTGHIYSVTSAGVATLIASIGEDVESMDIATSAWGAFAGDLLVSSEGSGSLRLVTPGGATTFVGNVGQFTSAETVSFVPLNLNTSDPLQGFYIADFPDDIQFAAASNFTSLLGDAIVTSEDHGSLMWDVHFTNPGFVVTPFTFTGNQIHSFEDGEFVTAQREGGVPEPGTLLSVGSALLIGLGYAGRRRNRR